MKKEKRKNEKEKDDIFETDPQQLSEEVRKRIQMRKELAERLKK